MSTSQRSANSWFSRQEPACIFLYASEAADERGT
jgi:hypothetical protein